MLRNCHNCYYVCGCTKYNIEKLMQLQNLIINIGVMKKVEYVKMPCYLCNIFGYRLNSGWDIAVFTQLFFKSNFKNGC